MAECKLLSWAVTTDVDVTLLHAHSHVHTIRPIPSPHTISDTVTSAASHHKVTQQRRLTWKAKHWRYPEKRERLRLLFSCGKQNIFRRCQWFKKSETSCIQKQCQQNELNIPLATRLQERSSFAAHRTSHGQNGKVKVSGNVWRFQGMNSCSGGH